MVETQLAQLFLAGSVVAFSMAGIFHFAGKFPRIAYNILANDWSR